MRVLDASGKLGVAFVVPPLVIDLRLVLCLPVSRVMSVIIARDVVRVGKPEVR